MMNDDDDDDGGQAAGKKTYVRLSCELHPTQAGVPAEVEVT